jgi:hypothetical protein
MKRILLIILAIFYLGVSQGATVYFHYCMGELVQLGLKTPKKANCDFCGMNKKESKKDSCCKNDVKQAKVDSSQKTAQAQYHFEQSSIAVLNHVIWESANLAVPKELGKGTRSNAPPQGQEIPVFIRNCTYRI